MTDAFGSITWWGFSPALDLLNQDLSSALERLQVTKSDRDLNVLLVGSGDVRHILRTLARSRLHKRPRIKFYVVENNIEVLARHLLFLSIVLEPEDQLGLQEKAELFLELYGNLLIRQQVADYVKAKSDQFIRLITDLDYMKRVFPLLDLSQLKFKERDVLEGVFKFWRGSTPAEFDASTLWDQRQRHLLKARYDSRFGVFDWDYSMKLQDKASVIHSKQYKRWRETGMAFEPREGGYEVPNRTLASGLILRKAGESIPRRGYWGDMINSPYLGFGIETENKDLLKKFNDVHEKTASDVAEHNVTSYVHELVTGSAYKGPSRFETVTEEDASKKEEVESGGKHVDTQYLHPVDASVILLSLNSAEVLPKKEKYAKLFDVAYFSNSMVHHLTPEMQAVLADEATVILETTKFMLDLRLEQSEAFVEKITGMAASAGCKPCKPCVHNQDSHAFFHFSRSK
ncbi:dynein axonemal assembly factor 3-like isoform X2 [Oscarella lobularis]|uniref:dynein axonemal assembly factor 3-like isoform X2 n=1 Tax=Oscarella lobularis TaxID=121494 RepID=UPI0033137237